MYRPKRLITGIKAISGGRFMREEDKTDIRLDYWMRTRRKWYNVYFFTGIGINLLLYFTKPFGFDPSGSIFWGSFIGLAIPMSTMFLFVYIHKKMIGL
jgi:hypothetical protein